MVHDFQNRVVRRSRKVFKSISTGRILYGKPREPKQIALAHMYDQFAVFDLGIRSLIVSFKSDFHTVNVVILVGSQRNR